MTVVRKDYYDSGAKFREDYQRKFDAAPFVAQTTRYLWYGLLFHYEASKLTCSTGEAQQNLRPNFKKLWRK